MVKADPDDHLVAVLCSVSSGSRAAFAEFYDRTSPWACDLLMQMFGDQRVSDELARSVYREVWACAPEYKTENGSPTAWVIMIAHRRAIEKMIASHGVVYFGSVNHQVRDQRVVL